MVLDFVTTPVVIAQQYQLAISKPCIIHLVIVALIPLPHLVSSSLPDMFLSQAYTLLVPLNPLIQAVWQKRGVVVAKEKVHWQSRVMSEHQKVRRVARSLVRSGVVGVGELGQVVGPSTFLCSWQCAQKVMQRPVEPFALTVSLWMVRCRSAFLNPVQVAELFDHQTLKIPALVGVYPCWGAESMEPLLY